MKVSCDHFRHPCVEPFFLRALIRNAMYGNLIYKDNKLHPFWDSICSYKDSKHRSTNKNITLNNWFSSESYFWNQCYLLILWKCIIFKKYSAKCSTTAFLINPVFNVWITTLFNHEHAFFLNHFYITICNKKNAIYI